MELQAPGLQCDTALEVMSHLRSESEDEFLSVCIFATLSLRLSKEERERQGRI